MPTREKPRRFRSATGQLGRRFGHAGKLCQLANAIYRYVELARAVHVCRTSSPTRPCSIPADFVATPTALDVCTTAYLSECLARHIRDDWGVVDSEDRAHNDAALHNGDSLLSAYRSIRRSPRTATVTTAFG